MRFSTLCFSLAVIATESLATAHEDGDIAVHVTITRGHPLDGAFCVEDEKQLILNTLGKALRDQTPDANLHAHGSDPAWCESLCRPQTAIFCKVFRRRCTQSAFERRLLSVHDEKVEKEELSSLPFLISDGSLPRMMLRGDYDLRNRRELQLYTPASGMTDEEEELCKDIKAKIFAVVRDNAGISLSNNCKSMMQQLLMLTCFKVGQDKSNDDDFTFEEVTPDHFMDAPDYAITTDDDITNSAIVAGAMEEGSFESGPEFGGDALIDEPSSTSPIYEKKPVYVDDVADSVQIVDGMDEAMPIDGETMDDAASGGNALIDEPSSTAPMYEKKSILDGDGTDSIQIVDGIDEAMPVGGVTDDADFGGDTFIDEPSDTSPIYEKKPVLIAEGFEDEATPMDGDATDAAAIGVDDLYGKDSEETTGLGFQNLTPVKYDGPIEVDELYDIPYVVTYT